MIGTSAMMIAPDRGCYVTLIVVHVGGSTRYFAIENDGRNRNIALNGHAFRQEFKALCEEIGVSCTY